MIPLHRLAKSFTICSLSACVSFNMIVCPVLCSTGMNELSIFASKLRKVANLSKVSSIEKRTFRDHKMWGNLSTNPAKNLSANLWIGLSGLLKWISKISAWFSRSASLSADFGCSDMIERNSLKSFSTMAQIQSYIPVLSFWILLSAK